MSSEQRLTRSSAIIGLFIALVLISIVGATAWDGGRQPEDQNTSPEKLPQVDMLQALNYPAADQTEYMDKLARFINSNKRRIGSARWTPFAEQLEGLRSAQKRQMRYQQCYFNPISCFRRK